MRYFSIVGNTPHLSMAELDSVLNRRGIEWKVSSASEEALLCETEAKVDWSELLPRLGGLIKAGFVVATDVTEDALTTRIEEWVRSFGVGRFRLGVSVYRATNDVSIQTVERTMRQIQGILLTIKKSVRAEDIRFRMVTSRERALSSVVLETNKVLEKGGELVVFVRADGTFDLGSTEAVQDFKAYRTRDIGRPRRNAKRGMLPPKVAQIMVNLAEVPDGGTIIDPFCGSGTVLQEAMLLGYKVIGSDISKDAVEDTRQNLEWLGKKLQIPISNFQKNLKSQISNLQLFTSDVCSLSKHLPFHSVDAIVTEPWLGPPLRGRETQEQLERIRAEARDLITDAFASFEKVLKSGGSIVMVMPIIGNTFLDFSGVEKCGWRIDPLRSFVPHYSLRYSIIYQRPDQFVAREIVRMRKD